MRLTSLATASNPGRSGRADRSRSRVGSPRHRVWQSRGHLVSQVFGCGHAQTESVEVSHAQRHGLARASAIAQAADLDCHSLRQDLRRLSARHDRGKDPIRILVSPLAKQGSVPVGLELAKPVVSAGRSPIAAASERSAEAKFPLRAAAAAASRRSEPPGRVPRHPRLPPLREENWAAASDSRARPATGVGRSEGGARPAPGVEAAVSCLLDASWRKLT